MNHFTYDGIAVGHTETFSIAVSEEMLYSFAQITGDKNLLHMNEKYAKEAGYKGRVVYGMLTALFMSVMAGEYLPGENSLIHKVEADFPAPVYVGDVLVFTGEVARKNDNFRVIELKITAKNAAGSKVLRGKMQVGVRR